MRSQFVVVLLLVFLAARGFGAEKKFDFSEVREGEPPAGFRSAVTGEGKPGNMDRSFWTRAPAPMEFLSPQAKSVYKRPVPGRNC